MSLIRYHEWVFKWEMNRQVGHTTAELFQDIVAYQLNRVFNDQNVKISLEYQGKQIARDFLLKWEKELPDFDVKRRGIENYEKTNFEQGYGSGVVGYFFTSIEGDEWIAGNLSYQLSKFGIDGNHRRLVWTYGEGLTLCGDYFSSEGEDPDASFTIGKVKKKCVKFK